jgi:surface protein
MFAGTNKVYSLNLSSFDTSNVTDMNNMFHGISIMQELDISSFDTSKVKDMSYMFYANTMLRKIIVGNNWNTNNVTSSGNMFTYTSLLKNYNGNVVDKTNAHTRAGGYLTLKED